LTLEEAASILGCSKSAARRRILAAGISSAGRYAHRSLSREAVEHLALVLGAVGPELLRGLRVVCG